jgi:uncharacterized protein
MTFLLDVNILIALLDPSHIDHNRVHDWFAATGRHSWATCPLTENSVLRIIGSVRYPNSPGSAAVVAALMQELQSLPGYTFWPDNISLLDAQRLDMTRLLTTAQVTDSYLLALAVAHGGQLATLDRRLIPDAVHRGVASLHLIGAASPPV